MTPFIKESIKEVVRSLVEAIILVAIVVLVFLQNWRSALIPLAAVPVAIIGTFAVMAVIHFSLNNLTLFGLVLAIGIVVDDAIVVVEAVEHHIEPGANPREASLRAMEQVSGPVVAMVIEGIHAIDMVRKGRRQVSDETTELAAAERRHARATAAVLVERDQVLPTALQLAGRIAANAPISVRRMKETAVKGLAAAEPAEQVLIPGGVAHAATAGSGEVVTLNVWPPRM